MKTTIEMAKEAEMPYNYRSGEINNLNPLQHFAEIVRADEREALIRYFKEHWRSDWTDDQIVEALEARGKP